MEEEEGAARSSSDARRPSLLGPIQQIVSSVNTSLQNSLDGNLEDVLSQLPSIDEHFYSYELVRQLQRKVEAAIGPLVESKLEERPLQEDGHSAVASITEEVLNSQEFVQLYQTCIAELREAVDEMLHGDGVVVITPEQQVLLSSSSGSSATQYYNLDDSSASGLSSVHQTGLMFMSPEQLQVLAAGLSHAQPLQVRLDSMHQLLQFPLGDLVSCDAWPHLRPAIRRTLLDPDPSLAALSLKFHQRMYSARTVLTTREVFLSLTSELARVFQGGGDGGVASLEEGVVTLDMGLDSADDRCLKLLARFHLLSHCQCDVPSYWLRYNCRVMEEVVGSTLSLLSAGHAHNDHAPFLAPVHFIALLDTKATWFRKWMHGQYSRTFVLSALKADPVFLSSVVAMVIRFGIRTGKSRRRVHDSDSGYYNERVLRYAHFIHSLCLLERLLLYKSGRGLFPVTIATGPEGGREVSVVDLLVHLLELLYSLSSASQTIAMTTEQKEFDPVLIIAHLLKEIASGNEQCRQVLCNERFISALIAPLQSSEPGGGVGEKALMLMGDVLAVLASTGNGHQMLLQPRSQGREEAPVHTVARFVIQTFTSEVSSSSSSSIARPFSSEVSSSSVARPFSPDVARAWLLVCRQLYNMGEGLLVLEPYQLHLHIAKAAWRTAATGSSGVGGGGGGAGGSGSELGGSFSLDDSLVDNLLNFAGTPKGLLLLQRSGLLAHCVRYMLHRYRLKLQVSKYEKFGYGCMVTQLASTAAGIAQLNSCGFVSMLVGELSAVLEGGGEKDHRLIAPPAHPLDPMERATHKALINLLNILSSFPALYEVLNKTTPPPSGDTPPKPQQSRCTISTVFDLLDQLVLVDSEPKRNALLDFSEAHLFGLRILGVLVTCLDSFLFLNSRYHFTEALLTLQGESCLEDSDDIIVDACSLQRNRILVGCYFIGGPNERVLPPPLLPAGRGHYAWPLFSSYPPPPPAPRVYQPAAPEHNITSDGELGQFLHQSGGGGGGGGWGEWLVQLRSTYCSQLKKSVSLSSHVVLLLLQKAVRALSACEDELISRERDSVSSNLDSTAAAATSLPPSAATTVGTTGGKGPSLSSMENQGMRLVIRYGQYLGLLEPTVTTTYLNHLSALLSQTKTLLSAQQHSVPSDGCELFSLQCANYPGFDWLAASLFLLTQGSLEETWELLQTFSLLLSSGYLWLPRLHLSTHLPREVAYSGIHPLTSVTAHYVELVLQSEVPLVYSAFRMSGYTPSQISQHWLRQCFWNYLDWSEVCLYLATCVVMGIDYQVYFCVAVLKQLEPQILQHTQEQNLLVFLKEQSVVGFHCADWLDFMQALEVKFRSVVYAAMRGFS